LAEADREMIVAATTESVTCAKSTFNGQPRAALALTCAARKGILGTRTREEGQRMQELLGDIPFSGFYTYGEIAPAREGGMSCFNNEMFVTLLLGVPE
ncbi:MAG: FIST C-terminal domain-containing protein, partial [Myxococcales bacterium]|nr:FIST C-terminal domain-containing protein [Myxococcales bacterium]